MLLRGGRVVLRPCLAEETDQLVNILNEPSVRRWWGAFTRDEVGEQFVEADDVLVVETGGEIIGAIQFEEETDPMYRHAGIDIFLATSHRGQGLGTEAIRVLARYLFDELGHHRLSIDPAVGNEAAIRAYERVGFRRVGVMRKYERGPDGGWHDGLLMDMLEEDLR